MRLIALASIPLAGLALLAGHAAASSDDDRRAEEFAQECADIDSRISLDLGQYDLDFGSNGRTTVEADAWAAMPSAAQNLTIWMSAYKASCSAQQRMMVEVEIIDPDENVLRLQPVSTELECHGDLIGPPGTPWYPC